MTSSVTVAQLAQFDDIIDVRSPSEFLEDHIPGAASHPVLDDEERARIGTLYTQVSPFEAKKLGAALVARNIAAHIEQHFADKPKSWRPLVYCWRGGKRSGSMAHILSQIGWAACQLEGGYRAYRRHVMAQLETLPAEFRYRVVCGATGTGKSRLLQALDAQGEQVLDLELLAAHRGSVLGALPDATQPGQKMFESRVWDALRRFDRQQPVYVEAESRKIGNVRVPDALLAQMWEHGECVRLEAPIEARVTLLKEEYHHFLEQPETLGAKLERLAGYYGNETIARWKDLAGAGEWDTLVAELLLQHYDPSYLRATRNHYAQLENGPLLRLTELGTSAIAEAARELAARG